MVFLQSDNPLQFREIENFLIAETLLLLLLLLLLLVLYFRLTFPNFTSQLMSNNHTIDFYKNL